MRYTALIVALFVCLRSQTQAQLPSPDIGTSGPAMLNLSGRNWTSRSGQTVKGRKAYALNRGGFALANAQGGRLNVRLSSMKRTDQELVTRLLNDERLNKLRRVPGMAAITVEMSGDKPVVSDIVVEVLNKSADFSMLTELKYLRTAEVRTQINTAPALKHLQRLPSLLTLRVIKIPPANTNLTEDELQYLSQMRQIRQLQTRVTNEGAKYLGKLTQLKYLALDMSPIGSAGLAHLTGLKNLETIRLKHTRINDGSLKHIGALTGLRHLDILYTRVNDDALRHLKSLEHLENIWLTSQVGGEGLQHLTGLKKLKNIVRNVNWQHDDAELEALKHLPLEDIYVRGREFTKDGLKHLSDYSQLNSLTIHSGDLDDAILANISKLKQLKKLMISIRLSGPGLEHVAELTNLRQLRLMSHRKFDDRHLMHLAKMTQLTDLELTCVPNGDEPYGEGLSFVAKLPKLQRLVVPGDYLSEAGWQRLAEAKQLKSLFIGGSVTDDEFRYISQLTNLETLSIRSNQLSDKSAAQLGKLKKLRHLDLQGGKMTDKTAEALGRLQALEQLGLAETGISDKTLKALEELPHLSKLDVTRTGVSRQGLSQLRQRLPFLEVQLVGRNQ